MLDKQEPSLGGPETRLPLPSVQELTEGEPTAFIEPQDAPHTELSVDEPPPEGASTALPGNPALRTGATTSPRRTGSLRWLRWYVSSSVGRRLMTMFVLAALVPVTLLASLSYLYVSQVLQERLDQELSLDARLLGATLSDRLLAAEEILRAAAASVDTLDRLVPDIGQELSGIAVLDRQGRLLREAGQPPLLAGFDLLKLDPSSEVRRSALVTAAGNPPTLSIVHAVPGSGEIGFIAASLSERFLWGRQSSQDAALRRLCVAVATGLPLSCPAGMTAENVMQLSPQAVQDEAAHPLFLNGERHRAASVGLAVNDRFEGNDLLIAALLPESAALHPLQWFRTMFLPVAVLSVVIVALLSLDQVRRILTPLRRVLFGMQRVARRDFGSPLPVNSTDEFGQMARSFNKMTAELGLHFRTLSAFSEIDRTILTTVDMRQVAEIALRCIHEISGIKVVSLGLLEADAPGSTKVYLRDAHGKILRDELPRAIDLSSADSTLRKWSKSIRLPAVYRSLLHEHGAKYLYLLPIARADRVWGVVVLGHDKKTALSTNQALALAGVIDRLAVALSSVARDKQLHDQAHFDSLTGLPNRHYLIDMLTQQVKFARRDNQLLAVLYIDLDRFKRTNDTLGHAAGDVLLRHAAARIRRAVRDVDIVARLGGDEFTVLLTNIKDPTDAGGVARTLISVLNEPFELDGHVMYAGGSIGIAIYPKDGENSAELLKKADTALYLAKDRGRGRYAYFEDRMDADASARVTIDRELREALRRGEFLLHYQPQIDLASGEVCAVEALLRWLHPQRGLLAPDAFIDHAEESGLIEAIGSWVLREACRQHRRWVEVGTVIERISVNVSAVQLRNPSFAASVEGALTSSTTAAHHLELEVTESLLVDAGPDAVATLERLRERGVEIAVDDFGTGYSSFAYVKQLPARVLKLDRTFITDVGENPQAAIIATAIIEMANALGKVVVAEGVETSQQAQFLRQNRCARAQGFVFSAAMPPEKIPAFVKDHERARDSGTRSPALQLVRPQPAVNAA
jgi:diguanylate cyclase (GGDEF)-like protein